MTGPLDALAALDYCYLTTTGRTSGEPREIEIWFALRGTTLFLMAGGRERAHWVRNIMANPAVRVRLGDHTYAATGRVLAPGGDEDASARAALVAKYDPEQTGKLADWGRSGLPVALDLDLDPG